MRINDISQIPISTQLPKKNNPSEKEMQKAAQDFAAVFYEKMLTGMLKASTGPKALQEDIWWEMFSREIAGELSSSPNTMVDELFRQLKKY